MGKSLQQNLFDYGELKPADVKRCETAVERIGGKQRRIASDIVAIGNELISVKDRLVHGQFGKWLDHYFGWSYPTAARFMQAAGVFKSINLRDLTIDQSALYLLSSDKCSDEVLEDMMQRAESGDRITHKLVKEALNGHTAPDFDLSMELAKFHQKAMKLAEHDRERVLFQLESLVEELQSDSDNG